MFKKNVTYFYLKLFRFQLNLNLFKLKKKKGSLRVEAFEGANM